MECEQNNKTSTKHFLDIDLSHVLNIVCDCKRTKNDAARKSGHQLHQLQPGLFQSGHRNQDWLQALLPQQCGQA